MPAGVAGRREVVGAAQTAILQRAANGVGADVGDQLGAGRGANLVIDDAELLALGRQTQHGAGKVAAACRIHPRGAKNQMLAVAVPNRLLASELGGAVDRQRRRCVVLAPGLRATAIKNVVGGVMHQQRAQLMRLPGQHGNRVGIDGSGTLGFLFGLVHRGVGRGIDDDIGRETAHGVSERVDLLEVTAQAVAAVAVKRHQFAQWRQCALRLPAHLAILAQQQDFHAPCPRVL